MPQISYTGLTQAQAEESRLKHGSNRFTRRKHVPFWKHWLRSFGDPIIKILLAALAVNLLFLMRRCDWYESVGIAIAVFLATFVSTLSEYGSEAAFEKLQEQSSHLTCRVIRCGKVITLPAEEVVVGDHLLLQSGERVVADGYLLSGQMRINQSAINGESAEVLRRAASSDQEQKISQLLCGSVVCSGEGVMLVQAVGDQTCYGRLAKEIQEESGESPLKLRLKGLANTISKLGYGAAGLVFLADLFYSVVVSNSFSAQAIGAILTNPSALLERMMHAVTLGITTVVVAVPEGLPMMITVVLSSNMRRMLRDKVLVRKLVGIETSGSMNLLFTDKTGTLTKGELSVTQFVCGNGKTFTGKVVRRYAELWKRIARCCLYNNESCLSGHNVTGGNATDRALLSFLLPLSPLSERATVRRDLPFDSRRKLSAVTVAYSGKAAVHLVKGAPEKILPFCTRYVNEQGTELPLTNTGDIETAWKQMTSRAIRVIALAEADSEICSDTALPPLKLIGLVGIRDDLRKEAAQAVKQLQNAGIQTVMITGDNRETACAIAQNASLLIGPDSEFSVLTGDRLRQLSDDTVRTHLSELRVLARALPEDKSRLVRLAQENGAVVGMTGDGINDAPALKKADVGFAMGSGTEVAKEAGDIIILDNNLSSIAKAVLYGRTIFKSIRKFIVFQLTINLCAVAISILGPFMGIDTPVTVVQMLWINIIMDTLAGLAFAGEAPLREYMDEKPKKREEPILNRQMLHQILFTGGFSIALCSAFLTVPAVQSWFRPHPQDLYRMSAFFALFIFCGLFNCLNARTHRLNLFSNLHRNPAFITVMFSVTVIQLLLIYFGGSLFRTTGITLREWSVVLRLALLVIPFDIGRKILLRLCRHNQAF